MCVRGAWRACAAHVLMARIQAPQSVWSECARMCSWRAYRRLHSETRVRMVHRLRVCLHFGRKCDLSARTGESTGTESGKKTPPRRGRVPIRRANRVRTTIDAVQRTRHAVPYSRRPRAPPDAGTSRGTRTQSREASPKPGRSRARTVKTVRRAREAGPYFSEPPPGPPPRTRRGEAQEGRRECNQRWHSRNVSSAYPRLAPGARGGPSSTSSVLGRPRGPRLRRSRRGLPRGVCREVRSRSGRSRPGPRCGRRNGNAHW